MASIKELKKEIDNSFTELGFLCHVALATVKDEAHADEIVGIYTDTVDKVEEVMQRVSGRDKKMKGKEVKSFFKGIRSELSDLFSSRIEQVSKVIPFDAAE